MAMAPRRRVEGKGRIASRGRVYVRIKCRGETHERARDQE